MCVLDPIINVAPIVPPMLTQVAAFTTPIVEGIRAVFRPMLIGVAALAASACGYPEGPSLAEQEPTALDNALANAEAEATNQLIAADQGKAPQGAPYYLVAEGLYRTCDGGRAIYVYSGYKSAGIDVVENAKECAK